MRMMRPKPGRGAAQHCRCSVLSAPRESVLLAEQHGRQERMGHIGDPGLAGFDRLALAGPHQLVARFSLRRKIGDPNE